jgi:hypothetical protein
MTEYKLKELEYVYGGFRARFTPVDDIEFFISDEDGIESLLHHVRHPNESVCIDVDDGACNKDPKIQFRMGCVGTKWYPCRWLKTHVDE